MKAEIMGFEKQYIEIEVDGKTVTQPIATLTLRSEVPKTLATGSFVEITPIKEEEKKEEKKEEPKAETEPEKEPEAEDE